MLYVLLQDDKYRKAACPIITWSRFATPWISGWKVLTERVSVNPLILWRTSSCSIITVSYLNLSRHLPLPQAYHAKGWCWKKQVKIRRAGKSISTFERQPFLNPTSITEPEIEGESFCNESEEERQRWSISQWKCRVNGRKPDSENLHSRFPSTRSSSIGLFSATSVRGNPSIPYLLLCALYDARSQWCHVNNWVIRCNNSSGARPSRNERGYAALEFVHFEFQRILALRFLSHYY